MTNGNDMLFAPKQEEMLLACYAGTNRRTPREEDQYTHTLDSRYSILHQNLKGLIICLFVFPRYKIYKVKFVCNLTIFLNAFGDYKANTFDFKFKLICFYLLSAKNKHVLP